MKLLEALRIVGYWEDDREGINEDVQSGDLLRKRKWEETDQGKKGRGVALPAPE